MKQDAERLDGFGRSALHYAARDGDAIKVDELIEAGTDPNHADRGGWTPLHFAAQAGSLDVVVRLLDAGATVDPVDSYGNTPLFRATFESRGSGDVIAALRSGGADPRVRNSSGVSPVDLARTIANFDVAQFYSDLA